jgi:hypothetical protein
VKFSHQMRYDAAPADVYAMLADPAFRERAAQAAGNLRHDVTVTPKGSGMRVVVDQTQPAKGIPSFAQKLVGDEIQIIQTEEWPDAGSARLELEIPGKPGHFKGAIALTDNGAGGTVESVTGELKVGIPLVGGRLEGLISDLLKSALRSEEQVGRSYLTT